MKEFSPAECFHLSEIINEELAERGWSLNDLVFRMRRFESEKDWQIERLAVEMFLTVHDPDILLGDMAQGFATAFDISPQFFMNCHESWRKWVKERAVKS